MHNIPVKTAESLRILIEHTVDYAGLFPPASLPLNEAFKNYLNYLETPYNWMLAKFICPAKLLGQLDDLIEKSNLESQIQLSVLLSGGKNQNELLESLGHELTSISDFVSKNNVVAETFELRLPDDILQDGKSNNIGDSLRSISDLICDCVGKEPSVASVRNLFCEVPLLTDWETHLDKVIHAISLTSGGIDIGFKLRTGGTEPSAFPTSEQIAFVIGRCCENNVKMKCTAGLHHPLRHFSSEVNTKMHGFLNVFAAGTFAYSRSFSEKQLTEVLNDEDAGNFKFTDNSFSWKEYEVSIEDVADARKNLMTSFGSCSFEEPINDLKLLNLI